MKKIFLLLIICISANLLISTSAYAQCEFKKMVKANKSNMKPYKYSGAAYNDFIISNESINIEIEFTAYAGQKFRLLFLYSGKYNDEVKISVYDRKSNFKTRKKIYEGGLASATAKSEFEPPKTGNYFIEYDVPASADNKGKVACVVLLVGYQETE